MVVMSVVKKVGQMAELMVVMRAVIKADQMDEMMVELWAVPMVVSWVGK